MPRKSKNQCKCLKMNEGRAEEKRLENMCLMPVEILPEGKFYAGDPRP